MTPETFRYITSALSQVFATLFFGNCIFLAIFYSTISERRERTLDGLLSTLECWYNDYIHIFGAEKSKPVAPSFPIKRIGLRNRTFEELEHFVQVDIRETEENLKIFRNMSSQLALAGIKDTEFGQNIATGIKFDSIKSENLHFFWDGFELFHNILNNFNLLVLRVLYVPAILVFSFVCLLGLTDTFTVLGLLGWIVLFMLILFVVGLIHTVYMAMRTVRRTHRVTVQKEYESFDRFRKERQEAISDIQRRMSEKILEADK